MKVAAFIRFCATLGTADIFCAKCQNIENALRRDQFYKMFVTLISKLTVNPSSEISRWPPKIDSLSVFSIYFLVAFPSRGMLQSDIHYTSPTMESY